MKLINLGEACIPLEGIVAVEKADIKPGLFKPGAFCIDVYYSPQSRFSCGFNIEYTREYERDQYYDELVNTLLDDDLMAEIGSTSPPPDKS